MKLKNKTIGICFSDKKSVFYKRNILNSIKQIRNLRLFSILDNFNVKDDKRDNEFIKMLQNLNSEEIIYTKDKASSLGKKDILDAVLIIACNENVIPRLANNIFDSPTMEIVKYQLINNKPVVLGVNASNALSSNAENIGKLLNTKNYYFIPFKQINPITKPYYICFDEKYMVKTLEYALSKKQIQPIILSI